ncbi:Na+ dependent nucleoside transporter domain-containing protein, partial [Candidatus Epulonipiscium fishelsonii]
VLSNIVAEVIECGKAGLEFVFGTLAIDSMPTGYIFAVLVLGNIVFVCSLISLLYYLGVIGFVVKLIGKAVGKVLGTTEVESFVATANMFLGQSDSPVLVSKYLPYLTRSEIMIVLVSGMGSMSVDILGGYVALGIPMDYLLVASALVPIGSIIVGKIILPQNEEPHVFQDLELDRKGENSNALEALSDGAMTGMNIAMAIGANLIAILAVVALVNKGLGFIGISLEEIFSYIFSPIGYLMGLEGNNIFLQGQLMGNKLILNEFIAFDQLGKVIDTLDPRTAFISAVSLSGYANLSSIGMCIGGLAILCPEKKSIVSSLAFKAMLGGFVVSILNAMICGIILLF